MPGVQLFYGLGLLGGVVFDILRLVHNHVFPLKMGEMFFVAQRQ